jgi:ribonuclease D
VCTVGYLNKLETAMCPPLTLCAQVLHGCANDVLWLQRDFHVYLVNVFDTEKAAAVSAACLRVCAAGRTAAHGNSVV